MLNQCWADVVDGGPTFGPCVVSAVQVQRLFCFTNECCSHILDEHSPDVIAVGFRLSCSPAPLNRAHLITGKDVVFREVV